MWYEVEEGRIGCSFPHFYDGYGRTCKSDWGKVWGVGGVWRGQTWDMKWSLAKKVTEVGPCYSKLGVTELQPQVFCFANKVLLEHG